MTTPKPPRKSVAPKKARTRPKNPDSFRVVIENPEDRVCVKMGLARVATKDGRVEYDWAKISELWIVDPERSLISFCKKYGIHPKQAASNLKTSPERKQAIHAVARNGYMLSVVRTLMASQYRSAEEDAAKFSKTLSELTVFAHSAAAFARARMMKMGPGGEEMVNVDAKSADVAYYARIARDASETMRNLLELKVDISGTDEERQEVEGITIDEPISAVRGTSEHDQDDPTREDQPQGPHEDARPEGPKPALGPHPGVSPDRD